MRRLGNGTRGRVTSIAGAMSLFASTCAVCAAIADDVVAIGPVDSVSAGGNEFAVLGRKFDGGSFSALSPGDYVAVHAMTNPDGSLSDVWAEVLGEYVAGSDLVYEKGVVTELKPFLGQLSIGGSKVDYTASLYAGDAPEARLGGVVAVSGIQPAMHAPVIVDNLMASADRVRDSLLQSGGVRAVSMQGSGVQSASVQGSGIRGASMQGSGVQAASMQGSGIRGASMQGSGVQSASMQGSGIRGASMQGSGVQAASMQGSGIRGASMQGSGVQSASMQGSGIRGASMQGSGVQAASMQGSGMRGQ